MRKMHLILHWPMQASSRLARDCRGAVAVLLAVALPIIIGVAGLGSEVAGWYFTTRAMQSAADSAASSAAASLATAEASAGTTQCPTSGNFCRDVARSIAATFDFTDGTNSTAVTVNSPPATTTNLTACSSPFTSFNCYVEVIISQPQTPLLSALFMSSGPTITSRAVALANVKATDDGCVVALGTAPKAIDISTTGSVALTLNSCAVYDNSPDSPGALTLTGGATITAQAAYISGTVSGSGLTTTDGTFTGVNPIPDPYANRSFSWPTPKPNAQSNKNCSQNNYKLTGGKTDTVSASGATPYVFCNGLSVQGNSAVNLCPGIYIIDQGTLDLSSGTLNAPPSSGCTSNPSVNGVTIVLANDVSGGVPADIKVTGGFNLNITAPTFDPPAGTTSGIAIFQDRVACSGCTNKVAGGTSQSITGVIYSPNNTLTYNGGSATGGPVCTKLVANALKFTGNSTFNSSCTSAGTGTINYSNGTLVM
jgi:Flp pilus assembly protein TadG